MDISDVLIHIDQSIGKNERDFLEESMRSLPGVVAPRFTPGKPHLLVVAFDPKRIKASAMLASVKRRGYAAQLVGA